VAAGAGADAGRVGERVLVDPILRSATPGGPCGFLGSERDGAFAEFVRVPAENAVRITSALSDVELASFPCSYGAAENLLERARVAPHETVLVTGASGGVGSAAVQLAGRRGARVIAVAGRPKAAAVRALGAAEVVDRESGGLAQLAPESVDVVLDVVGGEEFPRLLEILKCGGRYAVAGAIAGPVVELDLRTLYLKDLQLIGGTILRPGIFRNLVGYIERGEIRALVSATYPLSEIVGAQKDFLAKSHVGKIVLTP
jgi:NADPH:quinone reductase-like Zn-dependent oxidoreductase